MLSFLMFYVSCLKEVMAEENSFKYFAYGSNMLSKRLQERTPSASVITIGHIKNHCLTFNTVSMDGSSKCDIEITNQETDIIYGVIFNIKSSEKPKLDIAEGLGKGYDEKFIDIETTEGTKRALAYIAIKTEKALQPYHWYKAMVICGAVEHQLPQDYIEWLRTTISKEDFNIERRNKNEEIIFSSSQDVAVDPSSGAIFSCNSSL